MDAANVANPLTNAPASISTVNFTPWRGPVNAGNMGNPSLQHLMLFSIRKSTLENRLRFEENMLSPCSL